MVWHRIARELGLTVEMSKASMTSDEYLSWVAFFNIELAAHQKAAGGPQPVKNDPKSLEDFMRQKGLA